MKIFLLLLILCGMGKLPAHAAELSGDAVRSLAQDPQWRRLLHYKQHFLSGYRSSLDGEGFFLSPEGAQNPEAELIETLRVLQAGGGTFGKLGQPAPCAFPARRRFLEERLGLNFPAAQCTELEDYHRKLDGAGVALVFATAYPNNPASMFGHSFLKISARRDQGKPEFLDWSLNYSAMVPEDENPFAFAFFGLTGGYAGQFALVPYYAKIEEYGNSEGRDIWEYDLNLDEAETRKLVEAVWEIETNSHFNYFFFDENCSYEVLTLLEIIKPEWKISDYFLHVIPGESVKRVAEIPGAVRAVRMRPSLERRLNAVARSLEASEWNAFQNARAGEALEQHTPRSLQAYLLYLQAEKKRKGSSWSPEDQARMREALLLRAKLPAGGEVEAFGGETSRPDIGHGAYRVDLGGVYETFGGEGKFGAELGVRFAYHDLLDPDPGYLAHSEILFPNFRFRYSERTQRFSLEQAELLSIVSLTPWNIVRKPISWRAEVRYGRFGDGPCFRCSSLHGEVAGGFSWSLKPERFTVWTMLGADADASTSLEGDFRFRPFLEVGSLATLPGEQKFLLQGRLLQGLGRSSPWQVSAQAGFHQPLGKDWGVRTDASLRFDFGASGREELRLLAVRYF